MIKPEDNRQYSLCPGTNKRLIFQYGNVLTIKKYGYLLPIHAKSQIIVLGNHEDWVWSKSDQFAPVLRSDSLWFLVSLAVERPVPSIKAR